MTILEIGTDDDVLGDGDYDGTDYARGPSTAEATGPFFHPDPGCDLALLVCRTLRDRPAVLLGQFWDDWIEESGLMPLQPAIILGFPPIPFTTSPHLVAVRAEVNAVVKLRDRRHVHFIMSAMARGGFSGGLVLGDDDYVIGVVTDALTRNAQSPETGFFTVVSTEPIWACLEHHGFTIAAQEEDIAATEAALFHKRPGEGER